MKTLKHTRKALGLSQVELAGFLRISRSFLYKAEKNICTLPSALLFKLAELEKKATTCTKELISSCKTGESIVDYCRKRISDNLYAIILIERKLDLLKNKYHHLVKEIPLLSNDETNDDIKELMRLRIKRSARKVNICGPEAQEKLKLKILLLHAEINAIEDYMSGRNATI